MKLRICMLLLLSAVISGSALGQRMNDQASDEGLEERSDAASAVIEIASAEELDALVAKGGPVVVKFFAPWCPACRAITEPYRELAESMPEVMFANVDVTQVPITSVNGIPTEITAIPTFHLFFDGSKVDESIGAPQPFGEKMKKRIQEKMAAKPQQQMPVAERPAMERKEVPMDGGPLGFVKALFTSIMNAIRGIIDWFVGLVRGLFGARY